MKNLYVIDAYNLIYRMFYAIPEMHTREGQIVNALFGVVKFIKSLAEMSPDDTIVVASESGSNFRETLYAEYKGTRDRMPDNLRSQIDMVFEFFTLAGIPVLVREGYEADDIIGSIVRDPDGYTEVIIISSDKDLCQFVLDGRVRIFDAMKQKNMRKADVIEKFGVPPEQVVDYLSIVGDSSDNIPGIAGFGPKKAVDLLEKYDTLQGIYREIGIIDHVVGKQVQIDQAIYDASDLTEKTKQVLLDQVDHAFLSQKLAMIVTDLDISESDLRGVQSGMIFSQASVIDFLKKYEFRSLIPADQREAKKELTKAQVTPIRSMSDLDPILEAIKNMKKIYLSTDSEGGIALGIGEKIYTIDPSAVDTADFFTQLFDLEDLEIVGYDLKQDLKKILSYKKSLQGVEGQGVLF